MRSLARYILTGPVQATVVVFGFALLSFPFPVLVIFSGGALALVALHLGLKQGVKILAISTVLVVITAYLVFRSYSTGPLISWLSVLVLVGVYLKTASLSTTLQIFVVFGLIATLLAAVFVPDLQAYWLQQLERLFGVIENDSKFDDMLGNSQISSERIKKFLPLIASVMTGGLISLYLLTTTLTFFLGRWWHGLQENIKAFRDEFITIKLGRVLMSLTILFVIVALVAKYSIFWQLAFVCLSMFILQGMAVAHAIIGQLSSSVLWFVILYGLLFLAAPQMGVALSTLGVLDSIIDFRRRFVKQIT